MIARLSHDRWQVRRVVIYKVRCCTLHKQCGPHGDCADPFVIVVVIVVDVVNMKERESRDWKTCVVRSV
jgi:hypothetical protein